MIKFVYFDVGGVALQDFTGANHGEEIAKIIRFGKFGSLNDFWNGFLRAYKKFTPKLYDIYIKNKDKRLATNKSIWPVIREINKTSKIGLLTNMDDGLMDLIKRSNLLPDANWSVIVDSSVVHVQKPDAKIYKIAEKMSGFTGKEILFIDNTKQNVDAAIKFGWNGFLYDPTDCESSSKKLLEYHKTL